MITKTKEIINKIILPIFLGLYQKIPIWNISFSGPYKTWKNAIEGSSGYQKEMILEKVKKASLQVKKGHAAFERDSVLFFRNQYPYPTITGLLTAALANKGVLNVIDYGGSLGSTYYQCNKFFLNIAKVSWNIIEQPEYVDVGVKLFGNEHLKFYYNIDDCIKKIRINIVLLLSVLQYITNPYELLKKISEYKIKYLIIDRTPVHDVENDIITVQHVPKKIYKASYPCWIFNKKKLMAELLLKYKILDEYYSEELPGLKKYQGYYFGAILELK